jgi:acyl-CoA reductase-like NAD-dependent aldehyde dehydrogenase
MFVATQLAAPLAAGNTLILKPAEQTPLSALELASDLAEIFPPGVVNILTGGGPETGAPLVQHPGIGRIAFTGSVETGREIMRLAADGIKPVTLELGGKNPMIVFADADMDQAVAGALVGTNFMRCQGQSCGSVSRLFLHERIHDEFVTLLQNRVEQIRIGSPTDEATEMGCLVSPQHQSRVLAYIESGKAEEGVRLVTGGGPPSEPELSQGCYVLPTILDGVEPQMKIAQEEIFGPVLSVLKWSDYEEVIAAANGVRYGLTASVWTQSLSLAHRAAADLEAGYIWINDSSRHFTGVPFGGYKQSGIGREGSLQELLSYTRLKSINLSF